VTGFGVFDRLIVTEPAPFDRLRVTGFGVFDRFIVIEPAPFDRLRMTGFGVDRLIVTEFCQAELVEAR